MKKYSILTVVSEQYQKFAKVFLESALDKLFMDKIEEICILNTGLSDESISDLKNLSDKIRFVNYDKKINSNEAWDSGWQENVLLKTTFVRNYLVENNITSFMIDVDSMFLNDVSDILDLEEDIILCDRSDVWGGMPYIASFVGFLNVEKSIQFLGGWIDTMKNTTNFATKETPALNQMVTNSADYNLGALSHKIIGLYNEGDLSENTRIVHFKGGGFSEGKSLEDVVSLRFERFKTLQHEINEYLER